MKENKLFGRDVQKWYRFLSGMRSRDPNLGQELANYIKILKYGSNKFDHKKVIKKLRKENKVHRI